jgi:2-phospho-L-lactate transferase/gluconeogenesis factor (CofD/UPF0052 family)
VGTAQGVASAPIVSIENLRAVKDMNEVQVKSMIYFVADYYNFNNVKLLIDLAIDESSLGQNRTCGDGGKSCGLFQYREGT